MVAASGATISFAAMSELFQFCLGLGVVAALFWVLYHLEEDWLVRFAREKSFRQDVYAACFGIVIAWFVFKFVG